jgi:flagellar assembly protein FliH
LPLLKAQFAEAQTRDAIVLNMDDLALQAEAILENARRESQGVIEQARQEAARCAKETTDQAFAQGHEQGMQQGIEQGREQAVREAGKQFQQVQSSWTEALDSWNQRMDALYDGGQRRVLDLAIALAEKILHRAIAVDHQRVVDQVDNVLQHVLKPLGVSVGIHPDDRLIVADAMPALLARMPNCEHIELIDDPSITRGGCVVRCGQGRIDATIDNQLDRMVTLLVPGHPDDNDASALNDDA